MPQKGAKNTLVSFQNRINIHLTHQQAFTATKGMHMFIELSQNDLVCAHKGPQWNQLH